MYSDHMLWGGMWMMFPSLLIFIALILVPLFLWRRGGDSNPHSGESETALEILKKRYAKGEISKQEFEQIKQDIA